MGRRPAAAAIHRVDIQWPRKPKVSESNDLEIKQLFLRPQTHFFCVNKPVLTSTFSCPMSNRDNGVPLRRALCHLLQCLGSPRCYCSNVRGPQTSLVFIGAVEGDLSILIKFWGPSSFHQDVGTDSGSCSKVLINHLNSDRRIIIGKLGQRTGTNPPGTARKGFKCGFEVQSIAYS